MMLSQRLKHFIKNWILPPAFYDAVKRGEVKGVSGIITKPVNEFVEKTKMLKDRHTGKRCFIIAGGPSIKKQDLKKLAGEFVICVSNTYVHPDYPIFKPQYHVLPHIMTGHSRIYTQEKFVGWLEDMNKKIFDAEIILDYADKKMIDENDLFRDRKIHWVDYCNWNEDFNTPIDPACIPKVWSVSELALTMAVYMGFEKIYLLGFDHDWFNAVLSYFYDEKTEHKLEPKREDISFVDAEYQMRRHAYIFKKYKYLYNMKKNIYNANADPNSYVDVFPKVDYDSLF